MPGGWSGSKTAPLLDLQYSLDAAVQATQMRIIAPLDPATALTSAPPLNLSHDAASQIKSAGYAYDALSRLVSAPGHTYTWDGAPCLVGVDEVRLGYNDLNDVITRTAGTATTYFHYNYAIAGTPIMAEMPEGTVGGATTETASASLRGLDAPSPLRYYVWTPSGQLLYMINTAQANKVYFYHFDHAGNTLALSDAAGQTTDAYAYDHYGQLLAHEGSSANPSPFRGVTASVRKGTAARFTTCACATTTPAWRASSAPIPSGPPIRPLPPARMPTRTPTRCGLAM